MAKGKLNADRGKIVDITLGRPIIFNGNEITQARIEIDHINHGLSKEGDLNKKKRTNFTIKDIEKFIKLLDGEDIAADDYMGKISKFNIRINCPVKGRFYGKEFLMIYDTHYDKENEIHTITLIPGW